MKILFASRRPVYPLFLGGAELSFLALARGAAERGHEVLMIGEWSPQAGSLGEFLAERPEGSFEWRAESEERGGFGTPTLLRVFLEAAPRLRVGHTFLSDFTGFFQDALASFTPDVVCTHLDGSYEVVEYCNYFGYPVLHFVRDTFHSPNFHVLRENEAKKRPTACVANSRFLADFLRRQFGVEAAVLYPIVDPPARSPLSHPVASRRWARGPGRRVMFANPARVKGGELMLEVVRELPEVDFVLVPGWGAPFGGPWLQLPNAEIHAWPVRDMPAIYATVDLVVVPTQENEAFGRVAIEAQHAGVPVAASRHSGFAEALGESAWLVDDFRDPAAWRAAIRTLLGSEKNLARLARRGRDNVRRFRREAILGLFDEILATAAGAAVDATRPSRAALG